MSRCEKSPDKRHLWFSSVNGEGEWTVHRETAVCLHCGKKLASATPGKERMK